MKKIKFRKSLVLSSYFLTCALVMISTVSIQASDIGAEYSKVYRLKFNNISRWRYYLTGITFGNMDELARSEGYSCIDDSKNPGVNIIENIEIVKKVNILNCIDFSKVDFSNQIMIGKNFIGSVFNGAVLREADISGSLLFNSKFNSALMKGANFQYSDLSFSYFVKADLRKVNFISATLFGCDFLEADLRGADLRGADLGSSNFSGAKLEGAIYNSETKLPLTLIPSLEGMINADK